MEYLFLPLITNLKMLSQSQFTALMGVKSSVISGTVLGTLHALFHLIFMVVVLYFPSPGEETEP